MNTPASTYRYFSIDRLPKPKGRKTFTYTVVSCKDASELGQIKWYGPWRQYCFFPVAKSVWSPGCIRDIQDFLDKAKKHLLEYKSWGNEVQTALDRLRNPKVQRVAPKGMKAFEEEKRIRRDNG